MKTCFPITFRLISFFAALTAFLFLQACSPSSDSTSNGTDTDNANSSDSKKPRVALIMKSLANPFFVSMEQGAQAHQKENQAQYELISNGIKNESDLAQQVALVDQMIAMNVDAIVIAPADSKALVPALARAQKIGITVVNIDNKLSDEVLKEFKLNIPFIGPSNEDGAKKVADFVLQSAKPNAKVAILEGIPTATNSIHRVNGFKASVKEKGLDLVTVQSAGWESTKAAEITSAILSQTPDIDFILAANDSMALGAASAIGLANTEREIAIAGFDNIDAIHPLIQKGTVIATAEQYGNKFAVYGIEFALDIIAGKLSPEQISEGKQTAVDVVSKESLASTP